MRQLILLILFCLFLSHVQGQTNVVVQESPSKYFNQFQNFVYTQPYQDSALYYAEKLASNDAYLLLLRDLIHNSFAQAFNNNATEEGTDSAEINGNKRHQIFCNGLLIKMATDSSARLRETIRPVYLLRQCQQEENNPQKLASLTNEFIEEELQPKNFYDNKTCRYGLLIYQIVAKQLQLQALSHHLFTIIKGNLESNQISSQVNNIDSLSRQDLEKRGWYRYLFAYVNYIEAKETNEETKKEDFLKKAFDYSPDLNDKKYPSSYFYDMIFLLGEEKNTFRDDYLSFLTSKSGNKEQVLKTLLKTALIEPAYKKDLEAFYNSNQMSAKSSFADYWMKAIDNTAKPTIPFAFTLLNDKSFSSRTLLGKWIMVDFWGTWCAPCREEHPALQEFYDSTVLHHSKVIELLTIACSDSKKDVQSYLVKRNFSFPVAMSDDKVENQYSVQGYPTKILITPTGKYITIPFGIDWTTFVKQYCSL